MLKTKNICYTYHYWRTWFHSKGVIFKFKTAFFIYIHHQNSSTLCITQYYTHFKAIFEYVMFSFCTYTLCQGEGNLPVSVSLHVVCSFTVKYEIIIIIIINSACVLWSAFVHVYRICMHRLSNFITCMQFYSYSLAEVHHE